MQQPQSDFWSYLLNLYHSMPPEVGQFVASMLGGAVGLIFFPPTDWKGGISQIFVSWVVSHYFSASVQKKYLDDLPIEAVRLLMGFAGWSLTNMLASVLKRLQRNPEFISKLGDKVAEWWMTGRNNNNNGNQV